MAAVLVALAAPAGAQRIVQAVPETSNLVDVPFSVGVPQFSGEIRLRNTATDPAALRRLSTSGLFARADGASAPVTWRRSQPAGETALLRPGEEATFTATATLAEPGVYTSWIEAAPVAGGETGAVERIRITVTRTADALPADFIADPPPASRDLGLWDTVVRIVGASSAAPDSILLTLRNTTAKRLEFTPPVVVYYQARSGATGTAVATADQPSIDAAACPSPLPASDKCSISLSLDRDAWFGEYAIGVGVGGVGGGWSERVQVLHERASAWLAVVIIGLGVVGGALVNSWRSGGRRALAGLIDIARLRETLRRLQPHSADADSNRLIGDTLTMADDIEAAVRRAGDASADLTRLNTRVGSLAAAVEIRRGLEALPQAGRAVLRSRWSALVALLEAPAPDKAAIDAALAGAKADIEAWAELETTSAGAQRLAAAVAAAQTVSAGRADAGAAAAIVPALAQAIAAAREPTPAGTPEPGIAARIKTLTEAISAERKTAGDYITAAATTLHTLTAELLGKAQAATSPEVPRVEALADKAAAARGGTPAEPGAEEKRLDALAALWKEFGTLEVAVAGVPAGPAAAPWSPPTIAMPGMPEPVLPINVLLPSKGSTLELLERKQRLNEWLTNAIVLVATCLAGVVALWVPDPDWGSVSDMITALLAGMAVNVAVGTAASR